MIIFNDSMMIFTELMMTYCATHFQNSGDILENFFIKFNVFQLQDFDGNSATS